MDKRTCVIVGTGQVMGKAIARAFGREGYQLALVARSSKNLEAIVGELSAGALSAGAIRAYTADVGDPKSVEAAFASIKRDGGAPDVVVYNVAVLVPTPPSEMKSAEILDTLPANLLGAVECVRAVLPEMRKRGRGVIIFTGGGFGIHPSTYSASHSIGKAALRNYAQNLHQELSQEGVHVATVTITRPVKPDTDYDPDEIARHYVRLAHQKPGAWEWEIIHKEL